MFTKTAYGQKGLHNDTDIPPFNGHPRNAEVLDILWHQLQEQRRSNNPTTMFGCDPRQSRTTVTPRVLNQHQPPQPPPDGIDSNFDGVDEYCNIDGGTKGDYPLSSTRSTWRMRWSRRPPIIITDNGEEDGNTYHLKETGPSNHHHHQDDNTVTFPSSNDVEQTGYDHLASNNNNNKWSNNNETHHGDVPLTTEINHHGAISTGDNNDTPLSPSLKQSSVGGKKKGRFSTRALFPWRASVTSEVV